ncbi:hypothetical protein SAMN05421810_101754 [Amycolatopsis arida]|uniref:Uncharacterized protein n=1 Tax=Amycolatopsis arida TaxID=587909 RepID=A0A1I5M2Y4_9PSEU|nr:hypothetical protein [Amycolatopsis arida]TDX93930.1 hypothetical protein CLV69_104387 [Amycolatopsis arida]SFP03391.1 hypothetical protein SAMN05421810_101754 [Amycolatopsis arida]
MRLDHSSRHLRQLAAASALVLTAALASCGNGDDAAGPEPAPETTTTTQATEPSPDQDGQDYFADGEGHLGEQVTITATVDQELNDRALVLDAGDHGDNDLLVLFEQAPAQDYAEGDSVTVTGTVERFDYERYSDKYGLVEAGIYDAYANEKFLDSATVSEASPTTS